MERAAAHRVLDSRDRCHSVRPWRQDLQRAEKNEQREAFRGGVLAARMRQVGQAGDGDRGSGGRFRSEEAGASAGNNKIAGQTSLYDGGGSAGFTGALEVDMAASCSRGVLMVISSATTCSFT